MQHSYKKRRLTGKVTSLNGKLLKTRTLIKNIKPIHPFAARMAPEIAFDALKGLRKGATVLDPMVGSGTVLRTVTEFGYQGMGFDIDPLAILMSAVWTTPLHPQKLVDAAEEVLAAAAELNAQTLYLPWIDNDPATDAFIKFWFADRQIEDLRKLSYLLHTHNSEYTNVLKLALSKQIITKTAGASRAADVSHSRPHKVRQDNDFDVLAGFRKTIRQLARTFQQYPPQNKVHIHLGDARRLGEVADNSVASIITSPPYLNALDYMRGHKLALVWLGYSIHQLSTIRGTSIGAEKKPGESADLLLAEELTKNLPAIKNLEPRKVKMIHRYALDMYGVIAESKRVLEVGAKSTFVIGNSCLKGIYIENSRIAENCAALIGLRLKSRKERAIPANRRYLPPPKVDEASVMKNRMRTEVVLSFINK